MLLPRFVVAALILVASGCAHKVRIDTDPIGARVTVDGTLVGIGPVEVEKSPWIGQQLNVTVEAENYESQTTVVVQSEWFPWPALLACTPMLGLPCLLAIPIGPFVTIGWAVVTSPTLLSLAFVRRYPDVVKVKLKPKVLGEGGVILPADLWPTPEDGAPNPLPRLDDGKQRPKKPLPSGGGNPLP